jgi:hypothetical protein
MKIHFCCVDGFWLIILYICNTQQDAHYEDGPARKEQQRIGVFSAVRAEMF